MGLLGVALNQNIWWYTARASGMVAWALVAASVFWGLIVSGRVTRRLPPPAWNLDLHRFLGALAVTFTAVHIASLAADKWVKFGWSELFVPFASAWRPWAVAWGITAMYLMTAIEISSLLMRRLPRRLWRAVHASAFVLFILATAHGLSAGTDHKQRIMLLSGLVMAILVMLAGVLRLTVPPLRAWWRANAPARSGGPPAPLATPAPAATAVPAAPHAPEAPHSRVLPSMTGGRYTIATQLTVPAALVGVVVAQSGATGDVPLRQAPVEHHAAGEASRQRRFERSSRVSR